MKKLIPILILCLLLSACGTPAAEPTETTAEPTAPASERILGLWKTDIDCSAICNGYILQTMGQELACYFDFTGITVAAELTLSEDGSFLLTISQEAVDAYTGQIDRIMHENLHAYLEQALQPELAGRTLDAYLEETGLTIDVLLVAAGVNMSQMIYDLMEPLRSIPCSGTYYLQDDRLHIARTVCAFTLEGDRLWVGEAEEGEELAAFPALLPMEFTR